jgi:hypothetical protein
MAKNSGRYFIPTSIADMAFLLLIFFFVATTIDIDTSLYKTQPSPSNQTPRVLKKQNAATVQVKSNDQLIDRDNEIPLSMLRQITKRSHENSQNKENKPEKKIESVELFEKNEIYHLKATSLYSVNYPCIVSLSL